MRVVWKKCKEEIAKQCTLADGGGKIYKDERPARVNQSRRKVLNHEKKKKDSRKYYILLCPKI